MMLPSAYYPNINDIAKINNDFAAYLRKISDINKLF